MNESSDTSQGGTHESFGSADPGSGSGSGHESSGSAPGPHPADPATHANPATPAAPDAPSTPATPAAGGNRNVGMLVAVGIAVLVVLAAIVGLVVK
jgi:hypothetical protein